MSKGQRGNKEAKKLKKAPQSAKPTAPVGTAPAQATLARSRSKT